MLVVVSDTHSQDEMRLRGRTSTAVERADAVVHAGDFYRTPVLDRFEQTASTLYAVYGNNGDAAMRERLPESRAFEYEGVKCVVTHRHRSGDMGLTMLGRGHDASLVICGHTHRPRFDASGDVAILNPGSYAQPRGNRPAHAELEATDSGLQGRLVTPEGDVFEQFTIDC